MREYLGIVSGYAVLALGSATSSAVVAGLGVALIAVGLILDHLKSVSKAVVAVSELEARHDVLCKLVQDLNKKYGDMALNQTLGRGGF